MVENNSFFAVPTGQEIHDAIRQMNPNSALGLESFTGHFFSTCWDVIKEEVIAFVDDFFKGGYIPQEITTTTLVLIPKVMDA